MALEDIFQALEEQAKADCDQILSGARDQAASIAADCEVECDAIRRKHVEQREREVRAQVGQALNAARLDARKAVAAMKEEAVGRVFDNTREALGSVRSSGEYASLFRSLLEEAVSGVDGPFEVLVDPADVALAGESLRGLGLNAEVRGEISTAAGVIVTTDDGRVSRRNTLEDRLDKVRQSAQARVAEILFS
ncbi:MAG: V-type ATP synthase subunit E [Coriobacteriia bacterium]|nr:V-type ATP synthase subunit E [Coriobacteriia bacterium]